MSESIEVAYARNFCGEAVITLGPLSAANFGQSLEPLLPREHVALPLGWIFENPLIS